MARPKLQFTEEQNNYIAQMVESNKTLDEIALDLRKKFDIKVSTPTIASYIKTLGLTKVDCRRWNARDAKNHKSGYVLDKVVKSDKKPLSKYSIKKHFNGEDMATPEEAKAMGYDHNGVPMFYKLSVSKEGYVGDVEWRDDTDAKAFNGGEGCYPLSKRWWIIQRMKFDLGDKYRPLMDGQIPGDWRGVVNRFKYNDKGFNRLENITAEELITKQQKAWERFVDAVYAYEGSSNEMSEEQKNTHNIYIINHLSSRDMGELALKGPDLIYHYIPQYLYGVVINYCLNRMSEEDRVPDRVKNYIENLKRLVSTISINVTDYSTNTISFETIRSCLNLHPNDYDIVVKMCLYNAIRLNLINRENIDSANDILANIYFERYICSDDSVNHNKCNDIDWFAIGDKSLFKAVYGRGECLNKVCRKFNLIPVNMGI